MRRALIVIALNNLLVTLGFNLWQAIFNNFAVEDLGVHADAMGLIQAIREIPGLMGFLVGVLALLLAEMRIAGLSAVLMSVGLLMTAVTHDLTSLIVATLVMSVGFHFFYGSNSAAVLLITRPDTAPKVIGRLNSLASVASVVGTVFVIVALNALGYRNLFVIAGVGVLAVSLALLPFGRQPARKPPERRRPPVHRCYWLYYMLEFLMGSRRHIFSTFAIFLLVNDYKVSAQIITLLFLINSLIGTYLNQAIGKLVARFGERRVLTAHFVLLVMVFMGYVIVPLLGALHVPASNVPALRIDELVLFPAFVITPALAILLGLFVADNVLFGFSLAVQTYLQKIALKPEDITPNLSLGQSINHMAAVVIPVIGGVVWETVGAQYTFLAGVVIVLLSMVFTQYMHTPALREVAVAESPAPTV